jgi:phosphate transport system substrate-binding protein
MGFASFVAGDIGQRIILKSGLLPIRTLAEKINFITNKKEKENE